MSWSKIISDLTTYGFQYNTEKSSKGFLHYDRDNLSVTMCNTLQMPDDLKVKLVFWSGSDKFKVFKEEVDVSAKRLAELRKELVHFSGIGLSEENMEDTWGRYSDSQFSELWDETKKFETWREIWTALAESQAELGLLSEESKPRISENQVRVMRQNIAITPQQIGIAKTYEKKFKHDVVAHIHAYGEVCPEAREIIHLGATSADITDNADLIRIKRSLEFLRKQLVWLIVKMADIADTERNTVIIGMTHLQPAKFTTLGKRICLWCNDLVADFHDLNDLIRNLKFRGIKGAIGTQDSFLKLFRGNHETVKKLDQMVAAKFGFDNVHNITGQVYPRKVDSKILGVLSQIAQSCHKFSSDLRLLQSMNEICEPRSQDQIGSSAMPHKRNPVLCERMCGLARYLISLQENTAYTAANQWMERTLDDSSNRRMVLPQSFLSANSILNLYVRIVNGWQINYKEIIKNVNKEFPFMIIEDVLMKAVQAGNDRQTVHQRLKELRDISIQKMQADGINPLLALIQKEYPNVNIPLEPKRYIGRASEQVQEFIMNEVVPISKSHGQTKYKPTLEEI